MVVAGLLILGRRLVRRQWLAKTEAKEGSVGGLERARLGEEEFPGHDEAEACRLAGWR